MSLAEGWPRRISFGQIAERHGISISDVFRLVEYIDAEVIMPAIGWEDMSGTGYEDINQSGHWTIANRDLFRLIYGDEQEITLTGENRYGRPITVRHLRADVPDADLDIRYYKDICDLIAAEKAHAGSSHQLKTGGPTGAVARVIHAALVELKGDGVGDPGVSEIMARLLDGRPIAGIEIKQGQGKNGSPVPVIGGKALTRDALRMSLKRILQMHDQKRTIAN